LLHGTTAVLASGKGNGVLKCSLKIVI
jgi:hypothetical protein